jgi:molecular chaperone HtpG
MLAKKTLELNPHHPVIKEMLNKVKQSEGENEELETELREYADLLFNMAMLNSGFNIENPIEFSTPL